MIKSKNFWKVIQRRHKNKLLEVLKMAARWDTQYGLVQVYDLPTQYIFRFYTGGWSENEEAIAMLTPKARPDIYRPPEAFYQFSKTLLPDDALKIMGERLGDTLIKKKSLTIKLTF